MGASCRPPNPGGGLGRIAEPSIDGVRALCVVAVVVYHLPAPWLPGGFLAVSSFFTLSGFLIRACSFGSGTPTGRLRLGRFALRRLRRLQPGRPPRRPRHRRGLGRRGGRSDR
ncbi:MAG: hypothetical protein R2705_11110 [Ilumatobacteraceae bacterium]